VSAWHLDFARADGFAGFLRLELHEPEKVAWYWTYLVGVPGIDGIVVVRDHEVPLPRQGLEIRADGLWAELWCETRGEHWTFGLEAFGVRLDRPEEALRPGGEIGERVPVGLDLEWEAPDTGDDSAATGGERSVESTHGHVHGDVLVGGERWTIDARGWFYADGAEPPPVDGEVHARVIVPGVVERALVRAPDGLHWTSLG
jgi:hypothetical protein